MAASAKSIKFEGTEPNINGLPRSHLDLARVPVEVSAVIYDMALDSEYQHGTGCSCEKDKYGGVTCPGDGVPHLSKIADDLGINEGTVHMYLDDEYRFKQNERKKDWYNSERGKSWLKWYNLLESTKEVNRRKSQRYCKTEHCKVKQRKWVAENPEKRKKYSEKYRKSYKGKIAYEENLKKRKSEEFRKWEREYIRKPDVKAKRKAYQQSERGKESVKRMLKKHNMLNYDSCTNGFKALADMIRLSYGITINLKEQNIAIRSFMNSTSITPNQIKYDLPRAPMSYINFFNETFDAKIEYDTGMTSEEKLDQKNAVWDFIKNVSFMPGEVKLKRFTLMKNKYTNLFNDVFDAQIDEESSKQESNESKKIRRAHLVKVKQHNMNNYKRCNTGFKSVGNLNNLFDSFPKRQLVEV
jgi:hypothetical protein